MFLTKVDLLRRFCPNTSNTITWQASYASSTCVSISLRWQTSHNYRRHSRLSVCANLSLLSQTASERWLILSKVGWWSQSEMTPSSSTSISSRAMSICLSTLSARWDVSFLSGSHFCFIHSHHLSQRLWRTHTHRGESWRFVYPILHNSVCVCVFTGVNSEKWRDQSAAGGLE